MTTYVQENGSVRLVKAIHATDERTGLDFDLPIGLTGQVVEVREGDLVVVAFANVANLIVVPKSALVRIEDGKLPPHAYWPQNESIETVLSSLRESIIRSELAIPGRQRAGSMYFIEDVEQSKEAYSRLIVLDADVSGLENPTTERVADLIRDKIKELSRATYREIVRDLQGLLSEVISPTTRLSTTDVCTQIQSMVSRIVTGSPMGTASGE